MHAVGQQSTVETLTTVAMATDKHATMEATSVFYMGSGPAQQCGSVFFGVRPRGYITRVFSEPVAVG
jgi:hypothetical protein